MLRVIQILFIIISLKSSSSLLLSPPPSVIVVGAGAAGIAAATRLLDHNLTTNVLVLEAEDRIGGRVNSIKFGESYIDLGAEWCHGETGNIVYELVKELDVLRHNQSRPQLCRSSKGCLKRSQGDQLLGAIFEALDVDESLLSSGGCAEDGESVGSYCTRLYNTSIYRKFASDSNLLEISKESFDLLHLISLAIEGAFSWFDVAAKNDYVTSPGDLGLHWNGLGYKTILDVLMKRFPLNNNPSSVIKPAIVPIDGKILLNKQVSRVTWGGDGAVLVECINDSTIYKADHVIFTPSLGVLKARHAELFEPQLPQWKRDAIDQIGFGAVMKVFLHFPNNWWRRDEGGNFNEMFFIWSENDKILALEEFLRGPVKNGRSWLTYLSYVLVVEHNSNLLEAWITGDIVPDLELVSSEILADGLYYALNKFLKPDYNISKPDTVISTKWWSNPNFRGTYSYQTVQSVQIKQNVSAEVNLAKPLLNSKGRPTILFAGEASHPHFYSTVHGAIETGQREADRIIELYK